MLLGCGKHHSPKERSMPVVKVAEARSLKSISRSFAALSVADDAVNLAFKLPGRVVDIPVAKGQAVRRGELLAEIDSRDVKLKVEAAEAAYNEAVSRLNRAMRLLEHEAISLQEVEGLESKVQQMRSDYNNALDELADTRIVAPYDGVVERTYVDLFQRVASGESVVRLVTYQSNTVSFTAPENLVGELSLPTTHFSVLFDAYPDTPFEAVIKSYARTSSDALGFPVSLRLVDVDRSRYSISSGMTCIATVTMPDRSVNAVSIPLTAIYAPVEGGEYVWTVGDDNVVKLCRVTVGELLTGGNIEVRSGIVAGQKVVVAGVYKLVDGESVTVIM